MTRTQTRATTILLCLFLVGAGSLSAMQGNRFGLAVQPSIFGSDSAVSAFVHVSDEFALKPNITYRLVRVDGETTSSLFRLGTAVDYYLAPQAQASPYIGIDLGIFERVIPGVDNDADLSILTYLAPRVGAQVMVTNLIGLYAHGGLQFEIFTDGVEASTFTTGLGVVLYVY
ncbi:MAG: hypothetical protein EA383_01520 [Spirochaetaceae bacterium]|nr:MAG: hypothetical protein EA383_01520 [Spirochaetaceae bacterium]